MYRPEKDEAYNVEVDMRQPETFVGNLEIEEEE